MGDANLSLSYSARKKLRRREREQAALGTPEAVDNLESAMLQLGELVEMPVEHTFTPGLYVRKIFMPAGTLLTSRIHNTEHPYAILSGRCSVLIPGKGVEHLEAGHFGITKPGTRRVLYIHEDTIWLTFHPMAEAEGAEADEAKRLEMIEGRIIERRELMEGKTTNELYQELLAAALPEGRP